jgi:hypothetical protein
MIYKEFIMAGQLPSFLSGSNVIIRIGDANLAYCQDLRFSRTVGHVPVRGIGSYGTLALEPVDFSVNGSMVVTRWFGISEDAGAADLAPESIASVKNKTFQSRGNTLFTKNTFNPALMLLSASFDIYVYQKNIQGAADVNAAGKVVNVASSVGALVYQIKDCRLTNYSFSFFPGQILNENTTFVGRTIING